MEDQSQRASSGIHYVRKICVNLCKSVSEKSPRVMDYNVVISVVLCELCGFFSLCGCMRVVSCAATL